MELCWFAGRFYKTAHFDFAQNIFECVADTEDCFQRGPSAGGKTLGRNYRGATHRGRIGQRKLLSGQLLIQFPSDCHNNASDSNGVFWRKGMKRKNKSREWWVFLRGTFIANPQSVAWGLLQDPDGSTSWRMASWSTTCDVAIRGICYCPFFFEFESSSWLSNVYCIYRCFSSNPSAVCLRWDTSGIIFWMLGFPGCGWGICALMAVMSSFTTSIVKWSR